MKEKVFLKYLTNLQRTLNKQLLIKQKQTIEERMEEWTRHCVYLCVKRETPPVERQREKKAKNTRKTAQMTQNVYVYVYVY